MFPSFLYNVVYYEFFYGLPLVLVLPLLLAVVVFTRMSSAAAALLYALLPVLVLPPQYDE